MTTYVDFNRSPLHQGSRSRTGDQVDRQLVADLLRVLGDCRLLWLPNLTDTTASTDRSRHAGTITWSESLVSWDTPRARLGSGVAVAFNGTDEEGDMPDSAYMSFGNGAVDSPFSVGALIKPDVNNAAMSIVVKSSSATAEEWALELDSSGQPSLVLTDESASASIGRRDATAIGTAAWVLLVATYDGSGASTGLKVYVDAALLDDTDVNSGTYTAMEDTAGVTSIGKRYSTQERFFDGSIAFAFVTGTQLDVDDVWAIKELANSYYALTL